MPRRVLPASCQTNPFHTATTFPKMKLSKIYDNMIQETMMHNVHEVILLIFNEKEKQK